MGGRQGESTDSAGVRVPPPLVFLGFLVAGVAADWYLIDTVHLPVLPRAAIGVLLLAAGLVFLAGALWGFRRARTAPEPWKPTTAIVSDGVYRITRNPMYVGMGLAYAGVAVLLDALVALALLPVVLAIIHIAVIRREERYLERVFGEAYTSYKARVRRWL